MSALDQDHTTCDLPFSDNPYIWRGHAARTATITQRDMPPDHHSPERLSTQGTTCGSPVLLSHQELHAVHYFDTPKPGLWYHFLGPRVTSLNLRTNMIFVPSGPTPHGFVFWHLPKSLILMEFDDTLNIGHASSISTMWDWFASQHLLSGV